MIIDYDLIVWDKKQKREVNIRGKPKDIKLVLEERELWTWDMPLKCKACTEKEPDPNRIDCCARCLIANQLDFLGEKGLIQTIIESQGHKVFFNFCIHVYKFYLKLTLVQVIFYPKFHPEFNYIEMYWGAAKKYAREHCEYNLRSLRNVVPAALNSVPLGTIRAYVWLSFRQIDTYRHGLTEHAAEYAVKNHKAHRTINEEIMNRINVFLNQIYNHK